MNNEEYKILINIIGCVESGGQVYGKRNYAAYTEPYTNTPKEHTITLGYAQNYGNEGRKLLNNIYNTGKIKFSESVKKLLNVDWVANRIKPDKTTKQEIINIISSETGKEEQDKLFKMMLEEFIQESVKYTSDVKAQMMYAEIRHLGGKSAAERIFNRCSGNYSLENILNSLKQDQNDTTSSNQVGDQKFWSRHLKCVEYINKYVKNGGCDMSDIQKAKILLRQEKYATMTGYTPDGKKSFVETKTFYKTPEAGDIVYFYSTDKGRVGHVGIVEKIDKTSKIIYTIEGNTRSEAYSENGGCVARHTYSYAKTGGTNRVNGFGRPNFKGAGVTVDEFINKAKNELGYVEKATNRDIYSKTGNPGYNNFQKYQSDVGAGNGDQWCQYFVDAVALYTVKGKGKEETTLNETVKFYGYVITDLNVRKWAGKEYETCSFSPLKTNTKIGVCDELKASNGDKWYYILYNNKHGFVNASYITTTEPQKLTVTKFLKEAKNVMNTARKNKYKYGDSRALPPCSDGLISCDRLIARTLWNLGYTDQRQGGETCGTLDNYLKQHGFIRSTNEKDIKKGSILLVKHAGLNYISHAFICVKFNGETFVTDRYDAGSDERIQTQQPLKNVNWGYTKKVIIYNIP